MMRLEKNKILLIFFLAITLSVMAQSGRIKQEEEKQNSAPKTPPTSFPSIITVSAPTPKITPTPTPQTQKTDDDEVIQISSALIPIPVSVSDGKGTAVTDLRLEDFEVKIDGREIEVGELTKSETSVKLVMLFDNSSSVLEAREFEKKAAVRFFKQVLRPEKDLAALFNVYTVVRLEQPFTKNSSQLIKAIERLPEPTGATALLDALVKAGNYLNGLEGRRIIVIVSDGEDTNSDTTFETALQNIQKNNCQVYVVKTTDFENYKRTGDRKSNANIRVLDAERRMQELASQTGGAVYSPIDEKELDAAFKRISAELSQQYVLSLYLDPKDYKGKFHELSVKVKSRQNLTIRHRKGFLIAK